MNENVFPFKSQKESEKGERILILRLPRNSDVFEAASMEIDEKTDSLLAKHLKAVTTPLSQDSEVGTHHRSSAPMDSPQGPTLQRRKRRKINWVRLVNIAFITFVTLTAIVPVLLSSTMGIAIFAATTDAPDAKIYRGDLMISEIKPVIDLTTNDVLLLHNDYTWELEIRRVISKLADGGLVQLTTSDGVDQNSTDSYTVEQSTKIHKVIRVVPMFGYWLKLLTSVPAKILGGIVVIAINVVVQIRRTRRRRIDS